MNFTKYIGIQYEEANCWDLIRLIYLNEFEEDIGEVKEQSTALKNSYWQKVNNIIPYDILVFTNGPLSKHVGMAINEKEFIHSMQGINSCISQLESYQWRGRLMNIFRKTASPFRAN